MSELSRRGFLATTAAGGAGLVLGLAWPRPERDAAAEDSPAAFQPSPFLRVAPDGKVTVWVSRTEMGQGVRTALPMLVAEELECRWEEIEIETADAAPESVYGSQLTGGSRSIRNLFDPLRRAGAAAREMLVAAAAERWGVAVSECAAQEGRVRHAASRREASFGALAVDAARLPVPAEPRVNPPESWRLVGTRALRKDGPTMVTGAARYGSDVALPGMLHAAIVRCPHPWGSARSVDDAAARRVPGVVKTVRIPRRDGRHLVREGVAVLARNTWAALRGAEALRVEWDAEERLPSSTDAMFAELAEIARRPGEVVWQTGDPERLLASAPRRHEAEYVLPFLAHAPMEPSSAAAQFSDGACRLWAASQNPQEAQKEVAAALGIPVEKVGIELPLLGGGFGRRLRVDVEIEAALLAREAGAPVRVQWTRADDLRHGFYRPASVQRLRAALGRDGLPVALVHRIVSSDETEYSEDLFPAEYIPHYAIVYDVGGAPLPNGSWRSVQLSSNVFPVQSFVDELAHAAGRDPLEYRLCLLDAGPARHGNFDRERMKAVLGLAASKAGWGQPQKAGRGRGIAFSWAWGTYCAEVAELEAEASGGIRVLRIVCAVDCGPVVNPSLAEQQIEGGVLYGLTAALYGEITVRDGRVAEGNLSEYRAMRLPEAPAVEVHFLPGGPVPGGLGEPPVPPVAPAVANALFAATGRRVRRLPLLPPARAEASTARSR
jgi:isoquinoline 1-oxidoreductase beta subunit